MKHDGDFLLHSKSLTISAALPPLPLLSYPTIERLPLVHVAASIAFRGLLRIVSYRISSSTLATAPFA